MADARDLKSLGRKAVRVRSPPRAPVKFMNLDDAIRQARPEPAAYVLASAAADYLYKGACRDLAKRLADHRAGRVTHTKNRRPLVLVHVEYCAAYAQALHRERFLKSGAGRHWLKGRMAQTPAPIQAG